MKYWLLTTVFFCLIACNMQVELDQEPYEAKVVVDGYIESGGFATVYLTWSSPFLTSYDSASIRRSFITTASVFLTNSKGVTEPLTLFRSDNFFPPFVYRSTEIRGETGETYHLTVKYRGKNITATTTIPASPGLGAIAMEPASDTTGSLSLNVQPWSRDETWLFVQVKSAHERESFHPILTPVVRIKPTDGFHRIPIYRIAESNLHVLDKKRRYYTDWPRYQYALDDTIMVKYGAVDSESYQLIKSIFADQAIQSNPFAINTVGMRTNINGGIGRWTGIGLGPTLVYRKWF